MTSRPIGFGGVSLGRRREKVYQPRFGLGTGFSDTQLDKGLMDEFVPVLESRGGRLSKKPDEEDPLAGQAHQNRDGTITVRAEMAMMEEDGQGKTHPHKSVFEAVINRLGKPIRLKVAEIRDTVCDQATVFPVSELRQDQRKPHPVAEIQELLKNPAIAVNAVIHTVDRVIRGMLPNPS